jgi:hypothetical protein
MIPIKILKDYSGLTEEEFLQKVKSENYVYTIDIDGQDKPLPKSFDDLKEDPNRGFATYAKGKIWKKNKATPPFIEFRIADAMYEKGIVFDDTMTKDQKTQMLKIVKKTITKSPDPMLKGLKLI